VTDLREAATRYLVMRRALGFKLSSQAQILMGFVDYCQQHQCEHISTDAAVTWAVDTPRSHDRLWWARRLMVVRIFARHLAAFDPATEIPPAGALPGFYRRTTPYLFSPDEIQALLQAAGGLTPSLRGATYRCLLGLLAVTGMRIGEACRLDRVDVDLPAAVITIRDSKFGKSRQIPVHASTVTALAGYADARDKDSKGHDCPAFFVSTRGTRVCPNGVNHTFPELLRQRGSAPHRAPAGPTHMICGTPSRSRPCWTGTATAATPPPGYRCCRPTSAMSTRSPPTGTCRQPRNC